MTDLLATSKRKGPTYPADKAVAAPSPLVNWLPQPEAAQRLGVSEKTLVRWAEQNKIQRANRPRTGKKPEPVYHPEEIEQIVNDSLPAWVTPAGYHNGAGELVRVSTQPSQFTMLIDAIQSIQPSQPPGPWLTLKQASERSGLTKTLLKRAIASGALSSIRDRSIKVRQRDLDNLDVSTLVSESKGAKV